MAFPATMLWELRATATAANLNGGGFDPANPNFVTDYTATSANTASPVISSATITFVSGDVGAYIYVQSGTNWTTGFYAIASVDGSGKATIDASIGSAMQFNSVTNRYEPSTVAGCATVASPTGGVLGVSYMHQDAAEIAPTDGACTTPSTTFTSAGATIRQTFIGNALHITAATGSGAVLSWFQIVSWNSTSSVVLDRTPAPTNNTSASTFRIGGAIPLGQVSPQSDDAFFEVGVAGNRYFFRSGTFTQGAATVSISVNGTMAAPLMWTGYTSVWGDSTTGTARPTWAAAGNALVLSQSVRVRNMIFTATSVNGCGAGASDLFENCKFVNTSTSTGRIAFSAASTGKFINNEFISYRGPACSIGSASSVFQGNTFHNSDIGLSMIGTGNQHNVVMDNLFKNNVTAAINCNSSYTGNLFFTRNTLAGTTDKTGIGINIVTGNTVLGATNNVISGFVTGIATVDVVANATSEYNTFSGNTTDVSGWQRSKTDITVDPAFTNYVQITRTNCTTSGSVLTSSGADFSAVTDNVDFCNIESGTGVTIGQYKITSHTGTTLTLDIAPGTDATADKVISVMTGNNLMPTGAV